MFVSYTLDVPEKHDVLEKQHTTHHNTQHNNVHAHPVVLNTQYQIGECVLEHV